MSERDEPEGAVVQEAVDTIVRAFGYPTSIELQTESGNGPRETAIEVRGDGRTRSCVLRFDGRDDEDPVLDSASVESSNS